MTTPVPLKERGDGDVKQLAEKKTMCGRDWNDDVTRSTCSPQKLEEAGIRLSLRASRGRECGLPAS